MEWNGMRRDPIRCDATRCDADRVVVDLDRAAEAEGLDAGVPLGVPAVRAGKARAEDRELEGELEHEHDQRVALNRGE